jgi:hypothetical protein
MTSREMRTWRDYEEGESCNVMPRNATWKGTEGEVIPQESRASWPSFPYRRTHYRNTSGTLVLVVLGGS